MTAPTFSGVIPPLVTPLTADRALDTASLERLVDHLVGAGCSGLFALGSSGETVYLTDTQQDEVLEVVMRTVAGRVPVLVGCIQPTTPRVIERARVAEKMGAAAIVATAPFYTLVGPCEVERHFRELAAAIDVPLMAYDVPVCVHVKLGDALLLDLAADGVLQGVKDSSGDDIFFRRLLVGREDRGLGGFAALTGHELMVDAVMLAGADGSVPGLGNVDPAGYVRLHRACVAGDWVAARREQDRLCRLFRIIEASDPLTAGGSTRGVGAFKTAMMLLGTIATNQVSLPMRPHDDAETARVRAVLGSVGMG